MPELPEVQTIVNQLKEKIIGKKIKAIQIKLPKLIEGIAPKKFEKIVVGTKIKRIWRRAKLLIIELLNNYSLVIHLKLTGRIIFKKKLEKQDKESHLIYEFNDNTFLIHHDFRQFGWVKLIKTQDLENYFQKEGFGPEPLEKNFTLEKFKELLSKKPRQKIKPLLMDQTFLAGVGNVYAQEACWGAKILPTRIVKTLSEKEISDLYHYLLKILKESIKYRGSSVDAYLDAEGKAGEYVAHLKVYDRQGKKCFRCGNRIKRITLAGRGTYFCPECQK
ncbi:MAG: bifunctional DNA-formamidopyrimidine glycosylase/DNA-(apurinic or apyrimidinic site) lyase [Patescibacteria group bacterium]|nr:bifunctional DNA-formamidopyrimidine glycosylase/DNA-(apurinic or apyrimidinic site) lyase [Patescibacteria group bacterium]